MFAQALALFGWYSQTECAALVVMHSMNADVAQPLFTLLGRVRADAVRLPQAHVGAVPRALCLVLVAQRRLTLVVVALLFLVLVGAVPQALCLALVAQRRLVPLAQ